MLLRFLGLFAAFRDLEETAHQLACARGEIESAHDLATPRLADAERKYAAAILDNERLETQLAAKNEQLAAERQRAAFWQERSEHWEAKFDGSNADAIKARETVADFVSQLRYGKKIFEHAPALPEKGPTEHKPIQKVRQQARVAVQQAEAQFDKDLREYVERKTKVQ